MSDVNVINLNQLKSYKAQFDNEKHHFINSSYATFNASYFKRCSDVYVSRMNQSLQNIYSTINKGYSNIDNWWSSYNQDVENLEKVLAEESTSGTISEPSVRGIASNLPKLGGFSVAFSGIIPAQVVSAVSNISFANNQVVTATDAINRKIRSALFTKNGDISAVKKPKKTHSTNKIKATPTIASTIAGWGSAAYNTLSKVGAVVSDTAASALNGLVTVRDNIGNWLTEDVAPWVSKAASFVGNTIEDVGATVATFVVSLGEGIGEFGEAIVDVGALAITGVGTVFTGIGDGFSAVKSFITGSEFESATVAMWENTKAFVAKEHVSGWFDDMYQNTGFGQWASNNAFFFDTTRGVGSGIGYISGIVALTIATFGVGGAAVSGTAATTTAVGGISGAAAATSGTQMAIMAAAAGIGRGTEHAWNDGANIGQGLVAGTLSGLWDGVQFFVGSKISGLSLFGEGGIFAGIGGKGLGTQVANSLGRVVLDAVDSGTEGVMQPLFETIYRDGYYDDLGEYITFDTNDSLLMRYSENFNDYGGFKAVLVNAVIGGGASLIGEAFNLRRFFKEGQDDNITLKLDEVITEPMDVITDWLPLNAEERLTLGDVDIRQYITEKLVDFIDLDPETRRITSTLMQELAASLEMRNSKEMTKLITEAYEEALSTGNRNAIMAVNSIINLINPTEDFMHPISFKVSTDKSCWDRSSTIYFTRDVLEWDSYGTVYHECGHALFDCVTGKLPDNWDEIIRNARLFASQSGETQNLSNILTEIKRSSRADAQSILAQTIFDKTGMSFEEYTGRLTSFYGEQMVQPGFDTKSILKDMGISDEVIDKIIANPVSPSMLAQTDVSQLVSRLDSQIWRTEKSGMVAVSDIMDAVFLHQGVDTEAKSIYTPYGHPGYYNTMTPVEAEFFSFHEMIANFTQLKVSGDSQGLEMVRRTFGDSFFDILEATFQKFDIMGYFNMPNK